MRKYVTVKQTGHAVNELYRMTRQFHGKESQPTITAVIDNCSRVKTMSFEVVCQKNRQVKCNNQECHIEQLAKVDLMFHFVTQRPLSFVC